MDREGIEEAYVRHSGRGETHSSVEVESGQDSESTDGRARRDADRELDELVGELRVVLPGVTVIFAFLLTVPFTAGFGSIQGVDRAAYFVSFIASGLAVVLLVGETAYHRLQPQAYDKKELVSTATHQAIAAIALVAVALCAVAFLVTDVLYSRDVAIATGVSLFVFALTTWFALPWRRRRRNLERYGSARGHDSRHGGRARADE